MPIISSFFFAPPQTRGNSSNSLENKKRPKNSKEVTRLKKFKKISAAVLATGLLASTSMQALANETEKVNTSNFEIVNLQDALSNVKNETTSIEDLQLISSNMPMGVFVTNIFVLTKNLEKITNPQAKAALQRNIERATAKLNEEQKEEEPKAEEPTTETPKTEEPKPEVPTETEEPKVETPTTETPKVEEPKAETPIVVAPPAPPVEEEKAEEVEKETKKASHHAKKAERKAAHEEKKALKHEKKMEHKQMKQVKKEERKAAHHERKQNHHENKGHKKEGKNK